MSKPIKISFEIEDNWNIVDFRNYIKLLMSEDLYEIYIISNANNSADIVRAGSFLGLPSENVIITNFQEDKLNAVTTNNIDIHFDNLQSFVFLLEETTDTRGVLVTPYLNKFYLISDYKVVFDRILKEIQEENGTAC